MQRVVERGLEKKGLNLERYIISDDDAALALASPCPHQVPTHDAMIDSDPNLASKKTLPSRPLSLLNFPHVRTEGMGSIFPIPRTSSVTLVALVARLKQSSIRRENSGGS
jgi:hypothetical protein